MENCNLSSLQVYVPSSTNPWDIRKANHLYRRLAFGAYPTVIREALAKSPAAVVDDLVNEAKNMPTTAAPDWAGKGRMQLLDEGFDFEEVNQEHKREIFAQVIRDTRSNNLRATLTLFWHNHFVTQQSEYNCASYMFEYYTLLQRYSLGNFKDFVREIGLSNAMLLFLNGKSNKKNKPNENYARELYELFTLGENNGYTQQDIEETSKALTGYNGGEYCEPTVFTPNTFNDSEKNIFGKVGNWGYDDAINILFEEKAPLIARFIISKLYKYFVSPEVDPLVVEELAMQFENDFELEPVLRKLFKSEHFFDEKAFATIIKSPYDMNINFIKVANFLVLEDQNLGVYYQNGNAGQRYFQPVDVAGWQGDYDWINTSTLTTRWDVVMNNVWRTWNEETGDRERLRQFAKDAAEGSTDVNEIVRKIVDYFLPMGFHTEANYTDATDAFKTDFIPAEYYIDGTWTLDYPQVPWQTVLLFQYLTRLPEFQLK